MCCEPTTVDRSCLRSQILIKFERHATQLIFISWTWSVLFANFQNSCGILKGTNSLKIVMVYTCLFFALAKGYLLSHMPDPSEK